MQIVNTILNQMSNISKAQANFLVTLLTTLMLLQGKMNFRNLSRYSGLCEKTYSRQFRKSFDFVEFNRLAVCSTIHRPHTQISVMDCSFCDKSGKHTWGLDKFKKGKQVGKKISTALLFLNLTSICPQH